MQDICYPVKKEFIEHAVLGLQQPLSESSEPNRSHVHPLFYSTTSEAKVHLFPVYCEHIVDSLTPTTAFLKLRHYFEEKNESTVTPLSYLLESVNVSEQTSRFSYLGAVIPNESGTLARKNLLKFTVKKEYLHDDPLRHIEHMLSFYEYHEHPDLKGIFTGGAVGYVGFECVKHFEPRTMSHQYGGNQEETLKKKDGLEDLPDAMFILSDIVIVFDHLHQLMKVVGHVPLKKDMKLQEIGPQYDATCELVREISSYLLNKVALDVESKYNGKSEPTRITDQEERKVSWEESINQREYISYVQRLKEHIIAGDIVQCVPARRLTVETPLHSFEVYRQLRSINPSPYMFYIDFVDFQLVGASPEMLVKVDNRIVYTHPIAGTRKRGQTEEEDDQFATELLYDEKERAEHIMLVDLGRNDVNRVCKPETTKVDSLMHIERYSHVMHIVSHLSGTLRDDKTPFDAFRSIFPAGTVSGAPKIRALELIFDNEPVKRGPYGGAVGYFAFNRIVDTCIGLRMMVFKQNKVFLQAGGGVVYDSDPLAEFIESENKLRANIVTILRSEVQKYGKSPLSTYVNLSLDSLIKIKTIRPRAPNRGPLNVCKNAITLSKPLDFSRQYGTSNPSRVLLIDNYDSFTWNVYQYFCELGADVKVVRNDSLTIEECEQFAPEYLVISPGPGYPKDSGISCDAIRTFAGRIPILGVCLGEQCIFEVFGGVVTYAGEIVHGKTSMIKHDGKGIFTGISPSLLAIRYHSLVGDPTTLPNDLIITATTHNGLIMAIRHREYVMEGVQFHPESVKTEDGFNMIANFLSMKGGRWIDQPGIITPKNSSILDRIITRRKHDIANEKKVISMNSLMKNYIEKGQLSRTLNLYEKLISYNGIALIAEIKRASPSKGAFDLDADAAHVAEQYSKSGVVAISVLTEPHWFQGSLEDIKSVRAAIGDLDVRPVVLMKDFIIDEYQILMGRISGADTCLLIVASLSDAELVRFINFARSLQMEPLVEVHTAEEVSRALNVDAKIIGINNRNLHTFMVDPKITMELVTKIPSYIVSVALSGIETCHDIEMYRQFTCKAALVGESLMLARDKTSFALELLKRPTPLVKICGLTALEDLIMAKKQGANFLGLIFTPRSKRCLDLDTAKSLLLAAGFHEQHQQNIPLKREFNKSKIPAIHYHMYSREIRLVLKQIERPLIVGVFADQPLNEVLHICNHVPLDLIQLHGNEDRDYAKKMPLPVIRSFSVPAANDAFFDSHLQSETVKNLRNSIYQWADACEFILMDLSQDSKTNSSTGIVCDWNITKSICDSYQVSKEEIHFGLPFFLAGGLNTFNITEAIRFVNPFAVDTCSGLEEVASKSIPPRKDPNKLVAFMNMIQANRTL